MRLGSLFTGAGGLDLGIAEVLPVEHVWVCDNDPAAARVLAHRWPDVPNLGDITAVDWASVEPADVLAGGFPCTDISNAGKREGISGAQSGLWSQFADAIRVLRPRYVFVENVAALVFRGIDRVLADLAALGFDAEWTVLPASSVGAPHRRERLFLVAADTTSHGWNQRGPEHAGQLGRSDASECGAAVLEWGRFEPAIRAWETILGRPAPVPTVTGSRGGRVLNPVFVEWLMGLPAGHVTEVDGLSRNDMLRLLGNGVVPQQAAAAYRWLFSDEVEAAA